MTDGSFLEGTVPSPNIWHAPGTYETENHAVDPDGTLWAAMRSAVGAGAWDDRDVLDLGCGTGFYLPRFAATARSVVGVEPHPDLAALARRRTRRLAGLDRHGVTVLEGVAQALPLPDASIEVTQARWAYFFGPGCEPGLAELDRVIRPGGTALVIDNDATRSTFGGWFRRAFPDHDPAAVERFWAAQGWERVPVDMGWRFGSRADFEAVVRIEFTPEVAAEIIAEHPGTEVDYAVVLRVKRY